MFGFRAARCSAAFLLQQANRSGGSSSSSNSKAAEMIVLKKLTLINAIFDYADVCVALLYAACVQRDRERARERERESDHFQLTTQFILVTTIEQSSH